MTSRAALSYVFVAVKVHELKLGELRTDLGATLQQLPVKIYQSNVKLSKACSDNESTFKTRHVTSELGDVNTCVFTWHRCVITRDDGVGVEDKLGGVVKTSELVEKQTSGSAFVERCRSFAEERVDLRRDEERYKRWGE